MKLRTRIASVAALALALVVACDDNPFIAGSYAVDGRWTGSVRVGDGADSVRFFFDLSLEQDRNDVTGSGEVSTATATYPVEVDGRWEYPNVNLILRSATTAPLAFESAFDVDTVPRPAPDSLSDVLTRSDSLVGTLRGSGLEGIKLALGRVEAEP